MGRPAQVVRRAEDYLGRHGISHPRTDAEGLMMSILGTDRAGIYGRSAPLSTEEARAYGRAICRRCSGSPLQHLTGNQPFRHLTVTVVPGVFIPRPETEELVGHALDLIEALPTPAVADIGTGSGAIALSIKHEHPGAVVVAVDRSAAAVTAATANAQRLGLEIGVFEGDLLEGLPHHLRGSLDLVVSNPPYIRPQEYVDLPPEVRADPTSALIGGAEVYERLVDGAAGWLRPGGWLVVEIGSTQAEEIAGLFRTRLTEVSIAQDLAGRDRIVTGRLA
jgi:release factor glutamine methyltransferase